jgi:uncharacterized membrane protein
MDAPPNRTSALHEANGPSHPPSQFVLTAHRSLSQPGFLIVMGLLSLISFVTGVAFAFMGAWPVLGFFGLDVLLVYIAFKINYRSGRASETIDVSPDVLSVTQIDPRGRRRRFEFNPYWVRILLKEWPDGRTDLRLAHRDREMSFGRLLTDEERREFAVALRHAVAEARSRHNGSHSRSGDRATGYGNV